MRAGVRSCMFVCVYACVKVMIRVRRCMRATACYVSLLHPVVKMSWGGAGGGGGLRVTKGKRIQILISGLKVSSNRANAKAKNLFDDCRLFSYLFCLFFDLFRFLPLLSKRALVSEIVDNPV